MGNGKEAKKGCGESWLQGVTRAIDPSLGENVIASLWQGCRHVCPCKIGTGLTEPAQIAASHDQEKPPAVFSARD
jgi:hypothetical protein